MPASAWDRGAVGWPFGRSGLLLGAMTTGWLERARAFADEFLFPTASEVDAMDVVPRQRLDRLAAEGFYGLAAPGLGVSSIEEAHPINAVFAGGCMTTTIVWIQHHGAVASCAFGPEAVQSLVPQLASGDLRSTVAFAGLLPEPGLRAGRTATRGSSTAWRRG